MINLKDVLIVGGSSGVGKSIAIQLLRHGVNHIDIVDKDEPDYSDLPKEDQVLFHAKTTYLYHNLNNENYDLFDALGHIDSLFITAGFGRLTHFENLTECEIDNLVKCNELAPIRIIKKYYNKIQSENDFYCAVMVSISGHVVSPLYSVYGASKAGLAMFIENINTELEAKNLKNRVLDCSPGFIEGTKFHNQTNDFNKTLNFASEIIEKAKQRQVLYIPYFDEVYKNVIEKYQEDPHAFGIDSYRYKMDRGRISMNPQCRIGYLSGTFDLFHIGHLNLLKNAKRHCDYLIVGVHKSGAWKNKETFIPLDERKKIVAACRYVDMVVDSCSEDSDAWKKWNYNVLFVGSDYKGTERFNRYETFFANKEVEIIYLPYTKSTSSTQLRKTIASANNP